MSILNVEHLSHGFGDRAIFSDVSFRLLKVFRLPDWKQRRRGCQLLHVIRREQGNLLR